MRLYWQSALEFGQEMIWAAIDRVIMKASIEIRHTTQDDSLRNWW
jgi:hypothetical protein